MQSKQSYLAQSIRDIRHFPTFTLNLNTNGTTDQGSSNLAVVPEPYTGHGTFGSPTAQNYSSHHGNSSSTRHRGKGNRGTSSATAKLTSGRTPTAGNKPLSPAGLAKQKNLEKADSQAYTPQGAATPGGAMVRLASSESAGPGEADASAVIVAGNQLDGTQDGAGLNSFEKFQDGKPATPQLTLKRVSSSTNKSRRSGMAAAQLEPLAWRLLLEKWVSRTSIFKVLALSFSPLAENSLNRSELNDASKIAAITGFYFMANLVFDIVLQRLMPYCVTTTINGQARNLGRAQGLDDYLNNVKEAVLESLDVLPILIAGNLNDNAEDTYVPVLLAIMPMASLLSTVVWRHLSKLESEHSVLLDSALRLVTNYSLLAFDLYVSAMLADFINNATGTALTYCAITLAFTCLLTVGVKLISKQQAARDLGAYTREVGDKTARFIMNTAHLFLRSSYGPSTAAEQAHFVTDSQKPFLSSSAHAPSI